VRGKAGLQEYTDEAAVDPLIRRIRERVTPIADPAISQDQSHIELELTSGEKITRFVEQSIGNLKRPLTDKQLEDKFRNQAVLRLPEAQVERLIELCWRLDELQNVGDLVNATNEE
jgi:2-methylcitrate dehydratase PrpD